MKAGRQAWCRDEGRRHALVAVLVARCSSLILAGDSCVRQRTGHQHHGCCSCDDAYAAVQPRHSYLRDVLQAVASALLGRRPDDFQKLVFFTE